MAERPCAHLVRGVLVALALTTDPAAAFHPPVLFKNRASTPCLPPGISCPQKGLLAKNNGHKTPVPQTAEVGIADVGTTKSLKTMLDDAPLRILDPDVRETNEGYALTFNFPAEVTEDGLDVSIRGRLLTIEARVTRENHHNIRSNPAGEDSSRNGGWLITRCTARTHSATRSFVLPDGVSNEVTASWVADGQVEIKLTKITPDAPTPFDIPATTSDIDGGRNDDPSASVMDDSGGVPVEDRRDDDKPSIPSSAAAEYLSGLKSRLSSSAGLAPTTAGVDGATSTWPAQQHHRHRSLLAALDDEFRDLVKAMWAGDGAVRFPTEEQVAATMEKAREERMKRVTALRRATMATDVSEKDLAYIVKVALPHGATRDDVKLEVTPDNNGLRVTFAAEGLRTISKVVRVPWDALYSDISAAFTPEPVPERQRGGDKDEGNNGGGGSERGGRGGRHAAGGVSGLEITVGKVPPQLPKSIDIM